MRDIRERILSRAIINAETDCWEWQGAKRRGYGFIKAGSLTDGSRRNLSTHRVLWELWFGPIPDGLTLDHLCHDPNHCRGGERCPHRGCCNPDHLEPVTAAQNKGRASNHNKWVTQCPAGHPYDDANTMRSSGRRYCRTCERSRHRARRARLAQ